MVIQAIHERVPAGEAGPLTRALVRHGLDARDAADLVHAAGGEGETAAAVLQGMLGETDRAAGQIHKELRDLIRRKARLVRRAKAIRKTLAEFGKGRCKDRGELVELLRRLPSGRQRLAVLEVHLELLDEPLRRHLLALREKAAYAALGIDPADPRPTAVEPSDAAVLKVAA